MEEHRLKMFENRVLRTCGPQGDGETGGCKKLRNEELQNVYCFPIITILARHVERMRRRKRRRIRNVGYWWESRKERDNYREQLIDGWIISNWILERHVWVAWA
jgi:hypothetical protein